MEEKTQTIRPTRKQRQMLQFIEDFIARHGYSPSYREIMRGLGYSTVSTVAVHINNLIDRGHLDKRDFEARSVELTNSKKEFRTNTKAVKPADEKWLVARVGDIVSELESQSTPDPEKISDAYILLAALEVLGLGTASKKLANRINKL